MKSVSRQRVIIFVLFFALVAALAGGVWRYGYLQALERLEQRGQADLRLAADRLTRNLQRFQELVVLLADHPTLAAVHLGGDKDAARALLLEAADKTSARNLIYVDRDGVVLAAAHEEFPNDLSASPYFKRAIQGALGSHHDVTEQDRRSYYFAAPSLDLICAHMGRWLLLLMSKQSNLNGVEVVLRCFSLMMWGMFSCPIGPKCCFGHARP